MMALQVTTDDSTYYKIFMEKDMDVNLFFQYFYH
jgi:hypothetical protein